MKDLIGTDFQKMVWNEIKKIPKGKTITYKELAIKIGKPKAYRAVASACAKNPLSGITPCHRVIRSDGKMGGYMGCLLYTSPSPRDLWISRMPSSA